MKSSSFLDTFYNCSKWECQKNSICEKQSEQNYWNANDNLQSEAKTTNLSLWEKKKKNA